MKKKKPVTRIAFTTKELYLLSTVLGEGVAARDMADNTDDQIRDQNKVMNLMIRVDEAIGRIVDAQRRKK